MFYIAVHLSGKSAEDKISLLTNYEIIEDLNKKNSSYSYLIKKTKLPGSDV